MAVLATRLHDADVHASMQALSDHGLDKWWYSASRQPLPTQSTINLLCARLWELFNAPQCGPDGVAMAVRTGRFTQLVGDGFAWVRVPRAVDGRVVAVGAWA
jgi:hypothetical protein